MTPLCSSGSGAPHGNRTRADIAAHPGAKERETLVGPNAWNLGSPNGLQRVDDVLNALKQYFHDCS